MRTSVIIQIMKILKTNMIPKILLAILLVGSTIVIPQDTKIREANKLFVKIEEGIGAGAVDKFSNFFSGKNFISLPDNKNGYFSANQSYYLLKDFLSIYQPISFKITSIITDSSSPFASGMLKYNNKGIRGSAIVFISLQFVDEEWRISQITIN